MATPILPSRLRQGESNPDSPGGNPHRANRLIAWLTGILTLALAVFSFILSFNALTDLAAQHHISIPALFPFLVEFGVVIFSLNALYRSLHGEPARWQWVLIIGSSLLAGAFNVLHAAPDWISRTMAACPSLFLLLSFETFLSQVKNAVKRSNVVQSLVQLEQDLEQKRSRLDQQSNRMRSKLRSRFEQERSKLTAELEQIPADLNDKRLTLQELEATLEQKRSTVQTLDQELEQKRSIIVQLEQEILELKRSKKAAETVQHDVLNAVNAERLNDKQQALNALLNFYRSNPKATLNEAGEAIERSKGTVSNYLNELEQAGLVHRNGQGVEVLTP